MKKCACGREANHKNMCAACYQRDWRKKHPKAYSVWRSKNRESFRARGRAERQDLQFYAKHAVLILQCAFQIDRSELEEFRAFKRTHVVS
jgi:hypothetical protein